MSTRPTPEQLQHLEGVAALGYLLNAIAHDMNNLLTNLMLGADQVQYGGGKEAIEILLDQVQRISGITRAIQRIGQRSMAASEGPVLLCEVLNEFVDWHAATCPDETMHVDCDIKVQVKVSPRHMVHALSLLALGSGDGAQSALFLSSRVEERPRSAWAGSTDTVPMGVIRLRRGDPLSDESTDFKSLVDGFFEKERTPSEVATMAAWEVVRKVRGRMKVRGRLGGDAVEMIVELPLIDRA